jgi:hypothetical protein
MLIRIRNLVFFAISALSLAAFDAPAQSAVEIVPAKPKAFEPVRLRLTFGNSPVPIVSIGMKANKITVAVQNGLPLPSVPDVRVVFLGAFPAGEYDVDIVSVVTPTSTPVLSRSTRFVVEEKSTSPPAVAPQYDWTDLWWNPAENGWGMSITMKGSAFFGAWYTYDNAGKAVWYTLQAGLWANSSCYAGDIIKTSGTPLGGINGLGAMTNLNIDKVGQGSVCFDGYDSAKFNYTVDGVSGTKAVIRQAF